MTENNLNSGLNNRSAGRNDAQGREALKASQTPVDGHLLGPYVDPSLLKEKYGVKEQTTFTATVEAQNDVPSSDKPVLGR